MRRLDHFGLLAPLYDRIFSPPQDDHLAELLELPSGGHLLDVGGGTGRIAQGLVENVASLTVADASRKMLMMANQKPGLQAVESLAEKLPFASGSMARVICVDAYHHLADQQRSLKELWRVLAPGGLLIIEEPDIEHFAVKLVALGERLLMMRSHFVRSARLARDMDALGAHVEVVRDQYTYWVVAKKL
jgi:demethylmenaquinone methyltransferase/2-methoxy-6-polyprenyl-1,4-benzoquinol methylase